MELNQAELECLTRIAQASPGETAACAEYLLQHLMAAGLIEQVPVVLLPMEMRRVGYRLTAAGHEVLRKHHRG